MTNQTETSGRPTWEGYWATVGSEDYLYARELIELSPSVRSHFAAHVHGDPNDPWADDALHLDWQAAAAAADEWPASGTERRLLDLVLSLVNPDVSGHHEQREDEDGSYEVWVTTGVRKIDVRDLGSMGSWRDDVAAIVGRYITGQPPRSPADKRPDPEPEPEAVRLLREHLATLPGGHHERPGLHRAIEILLHGEQR